MLRKVSIGTRIVAIMTLLIIAIASLMIIMITTVQSEMERGVADAKKIMLEAEREKIKLGTHSMSTALSRLLEGESDSIKQAEIIAKVINTIRFEDDHSGYYYAYRGTHVFVHPVQPALVGKDLANAKDINGVYYVSDLNALAQKGGGYVSFIFGKPQPNGTVVNTPKLAYVEMIAGTNIWLSTGIYIDNINKEAARMQEEKTTALFDRMAWIMSVILAFLFLVLIPLCILTVKSISLPLRATSLAAEDIAKGQLNLTLEVTGKDEVTALQSSILRMAANLRMSFAETEAKTQEAQRQATEAQRAAKEAEAATSKAVAARANIETAVTKLERIVQAVSSASALLSAHVTNSKQQSGITSERIAETATAMEEMNATVLEVARNASQAAQVSNDAKTRAEQGAAVVGNAVKCINDVEQQSLKLRSDMLQLDQQAEAIGTIMSVISDIADQTNLLALNAAIEAARAGDAGRGFAVVADEVRKLAEKTMQATVEVSNAIKGVQHSTAQSMRGVDASNQIITQAAELVREAGTALREIVALGETSADQVRTIATAAEEQSSTSEEINRSLGMVNEASAGTAHAMTEAAQAVSNLAQQAQGLTQIIEDMKRS